MNPFGYFTLWALGLAGTVVALVEPAAWRFFWLAALGLGYAGAIVVGAWRPRLGFFVTLINRGSVEQGSVTLTFDGGPRAEPLLALLACLRQEKVPAAFFCSGQAGAAQADLLRRAVAEGHLIASRAYSRYPGRAVWSAQAVRRELQQGLQALAGVLRQRPRFVRLPPGLARPGVSRILDELGVLGIGWDVSGREHELHAPERIADWVAAQARNGSIIALDLDQDQVAATAALVIGRLRDRGFTFPRLDQLLDVPGYDEA